MSPTFFPANFAAIKVKGVATEGYTLPAGEMAVVTYGNAAGNFATRVHGPTETIGAFNLGPTLWTRISGVILINAP